MEDVCVCEGQVGAPANNDLKGAILRNHCECVKMEKRELWAKLKNFTGTFRMTPAFI